MSREAINQVSKDRAPPAAGKVPAQGERAEGGQASPLPETGPWGRGDAHTWGQGWPRKKWALPAGSSRGLAGGTAPTPGSSLALGPGRRPDEEGCGVTSVFIMVTPGLNGAPERREEGWVIGREHCRQEEVVGRQAPSPFPLRTTSSWGD